jgi:SPOR domain
MTDSDRNDLNLDDPDRLPWLETADGYEYDSGASPVKIAGLVLGGLALLAAIVGGIYWAQRNQAAGTEGNGELIAAAEGDYKVPPVDAGGKKFEGEGDAAFAASEGKKTAASIGESKDAETVSVTAKAAAQPAPAGTVLVQLGAFSSVAMADETWGDLSKRFGFLSGVNRKVAEGTAEGGRKIFRLQALTSDAASAQQLCAKLKAAGEGCLIVK